MKVFSKKAIIALSSAVLILCTSMLVGCGLMADDTVYAKTAEGLISSDGFYYDLYENGSAEITGANLQTQHMIIPDTVDSHPVTSIASGAFRESVTITYLTIGANVTRIGSRAFSGCEALVCVDGGKSLTEIGDSAFSYCTILCRFTSTGHLTEISDAAFFGCSSLSVITMPPTLVSVGAQAFFGCSLLTEMYLPSTCRSIGYGAFAECTSLSAASLGSVEAVSANAFAGCNGCS